MKEKRSLCASSRHNAVWRVNDQSVRVLKKKKKKLDVREHRIYPPENINHSKAVRKLNFEFKIEQLISN